MSISIVIADDHPLITEALVALFAEKNDFQIVAVCCDGDQTLAALKNHKPDILLLDIRMPGTDGLAVLREMKREKLSTRAVLLTAEVSDKEVTEAVRFGARGLLLKALAPKLIVRCVRDVAAGKLWLEKGSVSAALESVLQDEVKRGEAAHQLTRRELDIVRHVATGMHNAAIGKLLFITEGTVKMHIHNIYQKLHIDSRIKLALYAQEKALV